MFLFYLSVKLDQISSLDGESESKLNVEPLARSVPGLSNR